MAFSPEHLPNRNLFNAKSIMDRYSRTTSWITCRASFQDVSAKILLDEYWQSVAKNNTGWKNLFIGEEETSILGDISSTGKHMIYSFFHVHLFSTVIEYSILRRRRIVFCFSFFWLRRVSQWNFFVLKMSQDCVKRCRS